MTINTTDLDIPGAARDVLAAENRLRDHFAATTAEIDSDPVEGATLRLVFRGFESFDTAHEKVLSVVHTLRDLPETESVALHINTAGAYDPQAGEHDERPAAQVNANLRENAGELRAVGEGSE